jgi:hypothetical protein
MTTKREFYFNSTHIPAGANGAGVNVSTSMTIAKIASSLRPKPRVGSTGTWGWRIPVAISSTDHSNHPIQNPATASRISKAALTQEAGR